MGQVDMFEITSRKHGHYKLGTLKKKKKKAIEKKLTISHIYIFFVCNS